MEFVVTPRILKAVETVVEFKSYLGRTNADSDNDNSNCTRKGKKKTRRNESTTDNQDDDRTAIFLPYIRTNHHHGNINSRNKHNNMMSKHSQRGEDSAHGKSSRLKAAGNDNDDKDNNDDTDFNNDSDDKSTKEKEETSSKKSTISLHDLRTLSSLFRSLIDRVDNAADAADLKVIAEECGGGWIHALVSCSDAVDNADETNKTRGKEKQDGSTMDEKSSANEMTDRKNIDDGGNSSNNKNGDGDPDSGRDTYTHSANDAKRRDGTQKNNLGGKEPPALFSHSFLSKRQQNIQHKQSANKSPEWEAHMARLRNEQHLREYRELTKDLPGSRDASLTWGQSGACAAIVYSVSCIVNCMMYDV